MGLGQSREFKVFFEGFWKNNALFAMMLGICSSLAVTNNVKNSIAMALGVIFVTTCSSTIISMIRSIIPSRIRMAVFMMVISTFTIVVDQTLKAYYPAISAALGPYVGLIITNCIVMGRAEAYAISNPVIPSFFDGLGVSCGYSFSILVIGVIRELLGFGTFLDITVLGSWWTPWVIMVMAPGAFFVLGLYIWLLRTLTQRN
ncbi:MAG: electron transport complex subunit RsxE [Candidatus Latescibacter sp.]|nr:electron transport complex subunit RsxE [Candidatus Latescibacter sp.]